MQGSTAFEMKGVVGGFEWGSLFNMKNSSDIEQETIEETECDVTIVDVGGGIGAASMALVRAFPEFSPSRGKEKGEGDSRSWKFIVQDRPNVVKMAKTVWEKEGFADLVENGIVNFVGDYFQIRNEF